MAKLQLSKSALAREQKNFKAFSRVLPSLDLKRQQVMAERAKAQRDLREIEAKTEALRRQVGELVPMLANRDVDLADLVQLKHVEVGTENVVGTKLPRLERVDVESRSYALLGRPHWVDRVTELLREMLELRMHAEVGAQRLALLERSVKTVTQRVNLFEKVLIPRAKDNIKRIRIYLSDMETAAVVRSKMSKNKHAATGMQ